MKFIRTTLLPGLLLAGGLMIFQSCQKSAPETSAEKTPVVVDEPSTTPKPAKKDYQITTSAVSLKVGSTENGTFLLKPSAPWKMNLEYPTKIKLTPSAGVTVGQTTFSNVPGDKPQIPLTEAQMKLNVPITGVSSGSGNIAMDIRFAVCTKETCVVKKETVAWKVTVSD